ncbi:MAG: ATP-binding protein [Spirochaetales bacterium]|nr:ATP-binding protein [Spirochaetales bacterium]
MRIGKTVFQNLVFYILLIGISVILVIAIGINSLSSLYYTQARNNLKEFATAMVNEIAALEPAADVIDPKCKTAGTGLQIRITVIQPDGTVIGDSAADIHGLENHRTRPEIHRAFMGEPGWESRYSNTLKNTLLYYAVPFQTPNGTTLVLRTSIAVEILKETIASFIRDMIIASILILAISVTISIWIARRITTSLRLLTDTASAYSREEFDYYADISGPVEIASLGKTMRLMANIIQTRIAQVRAQKNELSAILSSMVEAVIVLNDDLVIEELNQAAIEIADRVVPEYHGKTLIDIYRNTALRDFAIDTLRSKGPLERDICIDRATVKAIEDPPTLRTAVTRYFQAHGTLLRHPVQDSGQDSVSKKIVIVLHDITRIRETDTIRKDFVANVSHELKTPITSIKGFVETLLEGNVENEDTARHFLSIIQKQSEQLNAIIDDLLSLSRLEKHNGTGVNVETVQIQPIIASAVQVCMEKSRKKNIDIQYVCDEGLIWRLNPVLIEQAMVNLIDNAVKYSQEQTRINVQACRYNGQLQLSVKDQGRGIPEKDLPRIFERFYRVDKARSREMGGTGLGLSIVKHIVLSHNGVIDVSSTEGSGSLFTITLPST